MSDERYAEVVSTGLAEYVSGETAEPRWAVQDVWPEDAMGLIGGRPKDGKSTLADELAVSLWSGTPMFALDRFPSYTRAGVLYVGQENADRRVRRDLQQILAARGLGRLDEHAVDTGAERLDVVSVFTPDWADHFDYEDAPPFDVISHQRLNLMREEDRAVLERRVRESGYRYIVLDPLYNLVGAAKISDGGDELRPVLAWLTYLKNEVGVAPIITHHMSDKVGGHGPASLIGTTWVHAWYEAALFTAKASGGTAFTITVDALRDVGMVEEHSLQGLGVGSWYYAEGAQGQTDVDGRRAPRVARKITNQQRAVELHGEHPDWSQVQIADELGVTERTVRRYLDAEEETAPADPPGYKEP